MDYLQRQKRNAAIIADFAAIGGNASGALTAAAKQIGKKYKLSKVQIIRIIHNANINNSATE